MAKKITRKELIEKWLAFAGYVRIKSPSRKYDCWAIDGMFSHYWVGRNGAIRRGRTVSESYSVAYLYDFNAMETYLRNKGQM